MGNATSNFTYGKRYSPDIKDFSAWVFGEHTIHIPNILDFPDAKTFKGAKWYKNRIVSILSASQYLVIPEYQLETIKQLAAYYRTQDYFDFPEENIISVPMNDDSTPLTDAILANESLLKQLSKLPGQRIEGFCTSDKLEKIANKTGKKLALSSSVSNKLNNKYKLRRYLAKAGFPIPKSLLIKREEGDLVSQAKKAIKQLKQEGCQQICITRLQSCSGQGIHKLDEIDDLHSLITERCCEDQALLIEHWLDNPIASPSVQVCIADSAEDDILIGITDQMLNHFSHVGNIAPSEFITEEKFTSLIPSLIDKLRQAGTRGIIGLDFLITRDPKTQETGVYIIEANVRQTGAIYGALLAMRLKGSKHNAWLVHNNVPIPENSKLDNYIKHLEKIKLNYMMGQEEGILLTSNVRFSQNLAMILCVAETKQRLQVLLETAKMENNN